MILKLFLTTCDLILWIFYYLYQLFNPFCYDPQYSGRFYKKYTIFYLLCAILSHILAYFSAYQITGISLNLLPIMRIFCSLLIIFHIFAFINRDENLLKKLMNILLKRWKLFISFLQYKVYDIHNGTCIISICIILQEG